MGRIVTSIQISNPLDPAKKIECDALVDTGSGFLVLPTAWKRRLGKLAETRRVELETADQRTIHGDVGGPLRIQVEGFPPVSSEAVFVDMKPQNGSYEILLGYIILEQAQAAVDMVGHRLVPIKHADLK